MTVECFAAVFIYQKVQVFTMNKALIIAGIAVAVVSKIVILKSILIDMPAYEQCTSIPTSCGIDPLVYFAIGWVVAIGGFIMIILGFRMPAIRKISR
jgi:hypothetical protein